MVVFYKIVIELDYKMYWSMLRGHHKWQ